MKLIYFGKMQRYFRLDGLNELFKNERGISVGRMISTAINHIQWPAIFVLVAPLFDAYLIK